MRVHGVGWLGTRTREFESMVAFYRDVLRLELDYEEAGFAVFRCPNGDLVEVFGHDKGEPFFTTGPVAGFQVDDVTAAKDELEAAGIELLGGLGEADGYEWWHFRGPDGNVYELMSRPRT